MEWIEKTVAALDLPEQFNILTHSYGGFPGMLFASAHPERVTSLLCLSPPCTQTYDAATYHAYGTISPTNEDKYETPKETDAHLKRTAKGQHAFALLHDRGPCLKKTLMGLIKGGSRKTFAAPQYSKELVDAIMDYWIQMVARPGGADVTMEGPFVWPFYLRHGMEAADRLGNPACTFAFGLAFGSMDAYASDIGGEALLNLMREKNGGRVNLFKVGGDTKETCGRHFFSVSHEQALTELIIGHFDGSIVGRWEPTVQGAHITAPRPRGTPGGPTSSTKVAPAAP